MDHQSVVSVLHRVADGQKEAYPRFDVQSLLGAVLRDRQASINVLHDEVRPSVLGQTAVEHAADAPVVERRQNLPLGIETTEDLLAVHTPFDHLESHHLVERLLAIGKVDRPHAAGTDLLQDPVQPDPIGHWRFDRQRLKRRGIERPLVQPGPSIVLSQQGFDLETQSAIASAETIENLAPLLDRPLDHPVEHLEEPAPPIAHLFPQYNCTQETARRRDDTADSDHGSLEMVTCLDDDTHDLPGWGQSPRGDLDQGAGELVVLVPS